MARNDDYDLDGFNIEDYTSLVDFGDTLSPDEEPRERTQSLGDTGRYEIVGESVPPVSKKKTKKKKNKGPIGLRIMKRVLIILVYLLAVIVAAYFLASAGWKWANDFLALDKEEATATITLTADDFSEKEKENDEGEVEIVQVADMDSLAAELHEKGMIEYEWLFKLFAQFTHKDEKLIPGTFELNTDMDYSALLRNMSARSVTRTTVDIMIPEGYTLAEIIDRLASLNVASAEDLWNAAANYDFDYDFLDDSTLGDKMRLEGYLFPDSYQFYENSDAASALAKMLNNFDSKLKAVTDEHSLPDGYSVFDIVRVASIVEKETDGYDQKKIASVIYNRLNNTSGGTNGYLQMDSTIQYILDERKETLDQTDLEIDSPYNTYKNPGLPKGAICNPGLEAITAAITPEESDYYYFILGDDGETHFFHSYDSFVEFKNAQTGVISKNDDDEGSNYEG